MRIHHAFWSNTQELMIIELVIKESANVNRRDPLHSNKKLLHSALLWSNMNV